MTATQNNPRARETADRSEEGRAAATTEDRGRSADATGGGLASWLRAVGVELELHPWQLELLALASAASAERTESAEDPPSSRARGAGGAGPSEIDALLDFSEIPGPEIFRKELDMFSRQDVLDLLAVLNRIADGIERVEALLDLLAESQGAK